MACGSDWRVQSASLVWILTLLLSESQSKKTQTYYMEASDCGNHHKPIGSAVVYSHLPTSGDYYPHNIECHITFQAQDRNWKLMLRMLELDIPDKTENGYCNDAIYVYDDETILTKAMSGAGGTGGLCGDDPPETLTSTGQFMTVVFKTDSDGRTGKGFKFIITAFSDDHEDEGTCDSSGFLCDNELCIDKGLVCDGVDSCGDSSDEAASGNARCQEECEFICQFLSLGITASIFIAVASIVVIISCLVAAVCCCRRACCRKPADATTYNGATNNVVTTATTVTLNGNHGNHVGSNGGGSVGVTGSANGGSVSSYQASRAPSAFSNHAYTHQGYYPMQPVAYPSPHHIPHPHHHTHTPAVGVPMYSYAKDPPLIAPPCSHYSSQYSQSQHSHSSHPPSTHARSYTPTSSKSGKSNRSNNSTSVTYSQGTEKVSLPVNL